MAHLSNSMHGLCKAAGDCKKVVRFSAGVTAEKAAMEPSEKLLRAAYEQEMRCY